MIKKLLFFSLSLAVYFLWIHRHVFSLFPFSIWIPTFEKPTNVLPRYAFEPAHFTQPFPIDTGNRYRVRTYADSQFLYVLDFGQKKVIKLKKKKGLFYAQSLYQTNFIQYPKYAKDMTLVYFSERGEIFWKKKSHTYPFFFPNGQYLFLLTSNNHRILIANEDGQILKQYSGPFVMDLQTDHSQFAIAFLGGLAIVGNPIGKEKTTIEESQFYFKSIGLSTRWGIVAIHLSNRFKDSIAGYSIKEKRKIFTIPLGQEPIPHSIPICFLRQEPMMLFHLGQAVYLYDIDSSELLQYDGKRHRFRKVSTIQLAENPIAHREGHLACRDKVFAFSYQDDILLYHQTNFITALSIPYSQRLYTIEIEPQDSGLVLIGKRGIYYYKIQ